MSLLRLLILCSVASVMGCSSINDFSKGRTNTSYYYDLCFGEITSEIRCLGRDVIDRVEFGFENAKSASRGDVALPADKIPVMSDFLNVEVDGLSFILKDLSRKMVEQKAGNSGHKAGYFEWGDSTKFYTRGMTVIFYGDRLVYFLFDSEGAKFSNVRTGKSASLPMTVGQMKKMFGEPDRTKKWSVL